MDPSQVRDALIDLPDETGYGDAPSAAEVYVPRSHLRAIDPGSLLVVAMRGAGKTFWWSALQNDSVRQLVRKQHPRSGLDRDTDVHAGFGFRAGSDYPSKDVLKQLLENGIAPRDIWRSVQVWQIVDEDHRLRGHRSWLERSLFVAENPETVDEIFLHHDLACTERNVYSLFLFDALDRCADDWKTTYSLIRGLLQTALDMRSYRRLRVKVFLRSDQVNEAEIANFPDASKVLSSSVELNWPRHELYGLLWHCLGNREDGGEDLRNFLGGQWQHLNQEGRQVHLVSRGQVTEEAQRDRFHEITGPWMGRGPKRGFPYTWIPNHLADADGRVSPRSFLAALRTAAEDTDQQHADHDHALHFDSVKRGVQKASAIRVREVKEDYPWIDQLLDPLRGLAVPCDFSEFADRWSAARVLDHLAEDVADENVKLPPRGLGDGPEGVRGDLESLGIFQRLRDQRVNMPDVFRVGYGLGRRGGVRPAR